MIPTPAQQELIDSTARRIVAIAGAGSGKSSTLAARIARWPEPDTVAITFTNAAARHIKEKIAAAGAPPPRFVGTLHAFILRTLTQRGRPSLTLLDESQAEELLAETLTTLRSKASPDAIRQCLVRDHYSTQAEKIGAMAYRAALRRLDAEDYDTLLLAMAEEMEKEPLHITRLYVDEYQDSGALDHKIYSLLDVDYGFYVGDPDQAIYGFRGGRLENLLELGEMDGVFMGFLEHNFRSGAAICKAADKMIAHNRLRFEKKSIPAVPWEGHTHVRMCETTDEETLAIVERVRASHAAGTTAVLCRYNADRKRIEQALAAAVDIPYQIARFNGLPGDWNKALAALTLVSQPENQLAAMAFIIASKGKMEAMRVKAEHAIARKPIRPFEAPPTFREFCETLSLTHHMRDFILQAIKELSSPTTWKQETTAIIDWLRREGQEQREKQTGSINVMTVHGAKGLEFDQVIVQGVDHAAFGRKPEEDRRLLYVAVTRAKHSLTCLTAATRINNFTGQKEITPPSAFLREMFQ